MRGLDQIRLDGIPAPEAAEWDECVAALREHSLRSLTVLGALTACWHRDELCAEQP